MLHVGLIYSVKMLFREMQFQTLRMELRTSLVYRVFTPDFYICILVNSSSYKWIDLPLATFLYAHLCICCLLCVPLCMYITCCLCAGQLESLNDRSKTFFTLCRKNKPEWRDQQYQQLCQVWKRYCSPISPF